MRATDGSSFFMELTVIKTEPTVQERVSLKSEKPKEKPIYETEHIDLSKNIQKFDRKAKIYKENPSSYNAVSLKKNDRPTTPTQTASQMIANKTYNTIGKVLGVDTIHEWNKYYDKVYLITEWATKNIGDDVNKIVKFLTQKSRSIPSLGARRIDDMYIHARMRTKL